MDFVQLVVPKVPVPYLSAAFELLRYIYSSVQEVQTSKKQLVVLIQVVAGLLEALNERYLGGKHAYSEPSTLLGDLENLLDEINRFVGKILSQHFIKTVVTRQDTIQKIDGFYQRIRGLVQAFEVHRMHLDRRLRAEIFRRYHPHCEYRIGKLDKTLPAKKTTVSSQRCLTRSREMTRN
ncbi:hypothetical protein MVEN_00700100 [Mycena venus]|uniref:Uncharacterized protein n=1 Tax=Mycena venus TaxID=2733690 RepID=A0A8H7D2K1_9AGAR|nr:hypothetical protein MVEN_00700100 [Mycena venus]